MKFSALAGYLPGKLLIAAGICAGLLATSASASADDFTVQYFQVTTSSTNSDFFPGGVGTNTGSYNFVNGTLSGGMPVYNSGNTAAAGFTQPLAPNDVGAGNVLEWWTPGTYGNNTVTQTGSGLMLSVSSNPGSPTEMFPPNSTGGGNTGANCGNNNCEETAILSGTFTLSAPGTAPFTVYADDDAFVFVDGQLVNSIGGIHPLAAGGDPAVEPVFAAGTHTIQIFYADQDQVQAQLAFDDGGVPINPTPEPGSLALLGTGILGIAGTLRRRIVKR